MPLPRFLAPGAAMDAGAIALPADEARHLTRVLRLRPGDLVRVFDGGGAEWTARVATAGRDEATVDLCEPIAPAAEPPVRVTLAVGLLKGAQMDQVVRDATALGAAAVVPIATSHVAVPAAGRRSAAAVDRWRRVAVAAAKQCGRAVVPGVEEVTPWPAALDEATRRGDALVVCVEPAVARAGGLALADLDTRADLPTPASATLFVGPEGGWAAEEIDQAVRRGAHPVGLGPRTLRAELVPAVLLSALWSRWGW